MNEFCVLSGIALISSILSLKDVSNRTVMSISLSCSKYFPAMLPYNAVWSVEATSRMLNPNDVSFSLSGCMDISGLPFFRSTIIFLTPGMTLLCSRNVCIACSISGRDCPVQSNVMSLAERCKICASSGFCVLYSIFMLDGWCRVLRNHLIMSSALPSRLTAMWPMLVFFSLPKYSE